jgi:hypothetical protein
MSINTSPNPKLGFPTWYRARLVSPHPIPFPAAGLPYLSRRPSLSQPTTTLATVDQPWIRRPPALSSSPSPLRWSLAQPSVWRGRVRPRPAPSHVRRRAPGRERHQPRPTPSRIRRLAPGRECCRPRPASPATSLAASVTADDNVAHRCPDVVATATSDAAAAYAALGAALDVVPPSSALHPPLGIAASLSLGAAPSTDLSAALGGRLSFVGALRLPHISSTSSDLAVGGAPYIAGLGPLPDATTAAQQRRGSPPGFPALAAPTWTDVVASASAPPPASSALVTAITMIQTVVAASRDREHAATLALEQEHAMGAALTA